MFRGKGACEGSLSVSPRLPFPAKAVDFSSFRSLYRIKKQHMTDLSKTLGRPCGQGVREDAANRVSTVCGSIPSHHKPYSVLSYPPDERGAAPLQ